MILQADVVQNLPEGSDLLASWDDTVYTQASFLQTFFANFSWNKTPRVCEGQKRKLLAEPGYAEKKHAASARFWQQAKRRQQQKRDEDYSPCAF